MMDLTAWAEVVARLLVPGGQLYIYEDHPLNWVWDTQVSEYTFDTQYGNYFSDALKDGLFQKQTAFAARQRHWTLGQIVNSIAGAGLRIEELQEFPEVFWDQFPNMSPHTLGRLPHMFGLLARQP